MATMVGLRFAGPVLASGGGGRNMVRRFGKRTVGGTAVLALTPMYLTIGYWAYENASLRCLFGPFAEADRSQPEFLTSAIGSRLQKARSTDLQGGEYNIGMHENNWIRPRRSVAKRLG